MEAADPSLRCPACQDVFVEPVTLPCGHHFCLGCLQAVWETDLSPAGPSFCPECQTSLPSDLALETNADLQCRVQDSTDLQGQVQDFTDLQRRVQDSTDLQGQVQDFTDLQGRVQDSAAAVRCDHCIERPSEAVRTCLTCDASLCPAHAALHRHRPAFREHTLVEVTGDPSSLKCREHRDELKLFCMEEKVPVCCWCALVGRHRQHRTPRLHEAGAELRSTLEANMSRLLQRRGEAELAIKDLEALYTRTVSAAADFRERVSDKYSRIRVVLDADERLMLQIIDAEETHTTDWLEAQRAGVEARIAEIDGLRAAGKALFQETNDLQFLQQISSQKLCDTLDLPPVRTVNSDLCDLEKLRTVERLVDDLSAALSQHFPRIWSYLTSPALDSTTAHPKLEISSDRKQVCWRRQPVGGPPGPQPYDSQFSALAEESFAGRQRYWEVIVRDKPYWMIGVTTGSVTAETPGSSSGPGVNGTSWCVYHGDGRYLACHGTQEKQLSVARSVRKLGVLADARRGELSFYDADAMTLLHSFRVPCSEPLYPLFNPCIDVEGVNGQPLTLFWIKDPCEWHEDENEESR